MPGRLSNCTATGADPGWHRERPVAELRSLSSIRARIPLVSHPAVFTEYVKSLATAATEPPAYPPEELLDRLGRILRAQMRRRGLWREPPRFLGKVYDEHDAWDDPGAFEDLRWDCFLAVIFSRRYLRRLRARADEPGGDIEGMIPKNVGRFLTERQQLQDPYGHAVFQNLKGAVQLALAEGRVEALGETAVDAEILLVLPGTEAGAEPAAVTEEETRAWCDDLTPQLCQRRKAVQRALASRLPRLLDRGRVAFRLRSLVAPLKRVVRPYCQDVDGRAVAEAWGNDIVPADPDDLDRLDLAVVRAIAVLDKPVRTRKRLETVWRRYVELARDSDGESLPSRNEVRRSLPGTVAKSTFNDDLGVLAEIVRVVRGVPAATNAGALPGIKRGRDD